MNMETIVMLSRRTLEETLIIAAPVLVVGIVVSLIVSVLQVMTSIQEVTISTVPRLGAAAVAMFVALPWMLRHMVGFTIQLFGDFHKFIK
jgi:flagellar biosynthetic protein FliQ